MKTHPITSTAVFAAALFTFASANGCAADEPKKVATVPTTTTVTVVVPLSMLAPASPGKANSTVYLSDTLRKACGITTVDTIKETPKFAFDQSVILPEDRDVLAEVARCLTTGALKGRSVKLVGRADPRGTPEYNLALGERRADAIIKYLAALGVGTAQMTDTSRGALDATGSDAAGWRQDRRVDIDLVQST
jgi:peptidoglycan-associated lipoprotein